MSENRIRVNSVEFKLGDLILNGYKEAGQELNPDFPNYLSGRQMAEIIDVDESTMRANKMSKELKALLGDNFTVGHGIYKMKSGGETRINLWNTSKAFIYWTYFATLGNKKALALVIACGTETLDRRINTAFGVSVSDNEYNKTLEKRRSLVEIRERLRKSHGGFQAKCNLHHFVARHVHDYATKIILGRTATESINEIPINPELLEYETYNKQFVGINHVLDEEYNYLEELDKFKIEFSVRRPTKYEDWKQFTERVIRNI